MSAVTSMPDKAPIARLRGLFDEIFGLTSEEDCPAEERRFVLASAPGRMEVAGNHVDHQGGRVISAAIGERTWGLAAVNGLSCIRAVMEGFGTDEVDLSDPSWAAPHPVEALSSGALVRGMAAAFEAGGGTVRGFDIVTCSDVPPGRGLSSSAAFEVMLGAALEGLFGPGPFAGDSKGPTGSSDAGAGAPEAAEAEPVAGEQPVAGEVGEPVSLDPVAVALAAVACEQRYFGKPCGAQDQLASACGGVVTIDFAPAVPQVSPVVLDAAAEGYRIVLVDSHQDHSLHQDEFAAIPADMRMVANLLGVPRLGDAPVEALLERLQQVRTELGDRRAMRALHYYDEVARVEAQCAALADGDFALFLKDVRLSGASSAQFLQNVSLRDPGSEARQPAMVIQSLAAHLLGERGAWRIHGGGFGGAVLAFVPADEADGFIAAMDAMLGYRACREVAIGGAGARARRLP
ncbi:galactokinase family protein [Eggerthellaceae bacterium 24-137]